MNEANPQSRWWILGAMGAILGVILLDETAVGVALPTITQELGMSTITGHWVVNIYLLTLAVLAGAAGRLGDILGTRKLLTVGLLVFGAASAAAGLAQSGSILLLARGVQGVGAAVIFPLSLVLVALSFDETERGMALGTYGAVGTVFLAAGPLVGGALTEGLSWRWIFWVNPILVCGVAAVVWKFWRDPPPRPVEKFDYTGFVLLLCGLSALIFGIMQGPDLGWTQASVLVSVALGVCLLLAFFVVETRLADPLLAVNLFQDSTFAASNLIVGMAQFSKIATFVFGALYFQRVEGWGALGAGLALLPAVIPASVMAPVAGRMSDNLGTRVPALLGVFLTCCGMIAIAVGMMLQFEILVLIGFGSFGVAVSLMFVPSQRAVSMSVPPQMQGQAGGMVLSSQLIGGTFGMAICSTTLAISSSHAAVFWVSAAFAMLILIYAFFGIKELESETA